MPSIARIVVDDAAEFRIGRGKLLPADGGRRAGRARLAADLRNESLWRRVGRRGARRVRRSIWAEPADERLNTNTVANPAMATRRRP